jgi:hypothetical protein
MQINLERARKVLEDEVNEARALEPHGHWVERVRALSKACERGNKTIIAMLGTALLAKATHLEVDPYSLKSSAGERCYSARALCQHVLAAEAPRLGIDLGVSGREPLNNQPFFGKERVSPGMNVHNNAKEAFAILLDALDALDKVATEREAREALRAFLQVRERKRAVIQVSSGEGDTLGEVDLVSLIKRFVGLDSEGGKRAQAVAAGLLDAMVGPERVKVGRINDPGRSFPGDVGVLEEAGRKALERAFEVKDKAITLNDIQNLVEKARKTGLSKVAMVAVAADQPALDVPQVTRWAETRGVRLGVYSGWDRLVAETLFWSSLPALPVGPAYRAILSRLSELEISGEGISVWRSLVK